MVRSIITPRCMDGLIEAERVGMRARTRSTVSIIFAPGWRKITRMMPGLPLVTPELRTSVTESMTLPMSDMRTAAPCFQLKTRFLYSAALNS